MSGHSKWANIKHRKGKSDAQKGKIFTKLGREITIAVKSGGPDPASNSRLKDAIFKAKSNNMPNDSIQRCVKKAAGDDDSAMYEAISYEGYGPSGVAMIVETLTDNRNRTAGDVRHLFDKYGGNLGASGCVSFLFERKGLLILEKGNLSEDEVMITALEAGAADFFVEDEYYEILTEVETFSEVREKLEQSGYVFESAEISMIPSTTTRLDDPEAVEDMEKLIERLEDHDDVQNIWHNWEQE